VRNLKTILWILVACIAGFLLWKFGLPGNQNVDRVSSAVPPDFTVEAPAPVAGKEESAFKQLTAGKLSPVVSSSRNQVNVDELSAELVMDRRVEDLGNGKVRRLSLINAGGEYPYHRIEEFLNYNSVKDGYVLTRQTLMVADHFLVTLRPDRSQADLEAFNKKLNARILEKTVFPNRYMVQLPEPSLDGVPDAVSAYRQKTDLVEEANEDAIQFAMAIPNDPTWSSLWDKQRINCPDAWDWETGITNIIVAVIDGGVDLDHPDLAAHLWRNPGEAGALATNGLDDDGDGYVDDWIGWDFGHSDKNPDDNGDEDYDGTFSAGGHGTYCAGIVGAIGNNSNQVVGVCWNVTIMALKAAQYSVSKMVMFSNKAEAAMKYAADHGAKVVSFSYGNPGGGSAYYTGVNYLNSNGVLFVAAAGNDGTNNDVVAYEPAGVNLPNVIAVASCSYPINETLSSFSNYGSNTVDIVAPGEYIYSTTHDGNIGYNQGTSMATPEVAGAIALLYSYDPDLPYLTCKQMILDGVNIFPAYSNKCVSHGRLNVAKSLDLLDASVPDLDTDGLPNKWEIAYFGGETNANSAVTASNGVNTVIEAYIAGLNPTSAASFFKVDTLEAPSASNGGFVVRWNAVTGRVYSIHRATNLLNSFQPLQTNIVWPQASYTDTVHATESRSFYKLKVQLAP